MGNVRSDYANNRMTVAQILVENARNHRETTAMAIGSENGVIIDSGNQNGTNSV
jgi:hypothetical protein